jgi:fructose-bisphosphate aldolase class II
VEAELGVLGSLETMMGDKEDGHGADGKMTREQLLTRRKSGGRLCESNTVRCTGDCNRYIHGAYKFSLQANRRHPGD